MANSLLISSSASPRRTFSEMAKVVCTVTSTVENDDFDEDFKNYQGHFYPSDLEDEDFHDENLISDEEDDNESGFLSQK